MRQVWLQARRWLHDLWVHVYRWEQVPVLRCKGRLAVTVRWNVDKKHRCPQCHTIVDDGRGVRSWRVYECCSCGQHFTRWPMLAMVLPLPLGTCKDIKEGTCPHERKRQEPV